MKINFTLLILATGEGISSKRRHVEGSSTVYYQQGPTQTIETYRMYSQPTTVTRITEETDVYQVPSHYQQQQNEITYSIQEKQPKYQPVSFLVTTNQDNTQYGSDSRTTTTGYIEEQTSSYSSSGPNFTKVSRLNLNILFLIVFI